MLIRAKMILRNEVMLAARERLGISQKVLSEAAGVSIGVVQAFERLDFSHPANPDTFLEQAKALAEVLGVSLRQMVPEELEGITLPSGFTTVKDIEKAALLTYMDTWSELRLLTMEAKSTQNTTESVEELREWMKSLTFRERTIIEDRNNGMTYLEVGRKFNITTERARQIELKGIQKLRAMKKYKDTLVEYGIFVDKGFSSAAVNPRAGEQGRLLYKLFHQAKMSLAALKVIVIRGIAYEAELADSFLPIHKADEVFSKQDRMKLLRFFIVRGWASEGGHPL